MEERSVSLRIKICGITNAQDALMVVDAGADALGFMFYEPSPRNVSITSTAKIIRELPPLVTKVGVFVNAAEELIRQAIGECGLDALQFHGDETPEFCRKFPTPVIKALRMQNADSLNSLPRYETAAWLLDSYIAGQQGGTGATFTWDLAVAAKKFGRSIILAGGLTPENVASAVRQVGPYGVDVSSGVESAPGKKDSKKVRAFIVAAKGAMP
jgi:phosphoribosylanthranilate isomerase